MGALFEHLKRGVGAKGLAQMHVLVARKDEALMSIPCFHYYNARLKT